MNHRADLAARNDVYEVRGFGVRRDQAGEPEFVIERLDGTSRIVSPAQMPAYLESHGWHRDQPLVVAEGLPGAEADENGEAPPVGRQAWAQVGAAANVFVFAPPSGVDVASAGNHTALAGGGSWEVLHRPAGRPDPLVTDPAGRLWAADAPAWLRMTSNGLVAPTAAMMRDHRHQYELRAEGLPASAFMLDLPLLPDGRLGVTFGDGSVRPVEEIGADEVVALAEAGRDEPIETVMLWTSAPTVDAQYQAFVRDADRLDAAFGREFHRSRPGFDVRQFAESRRSVNFMQLFQAGRGTEILQRLFGNGPGDE
jgi:hypothetical protein